MKMQFYIYAKMYLIINIKIMWLIFYENYLLMFLNNRIASCFRDGNMFGFKGALASDVRRFRVTRNSGN